jgi:predicted O-methyltransferase YrrM
MSQDLWTNVDRYMNSALIPTDSTLELALKTAADAGLPDIQVAPNQGKLLAILAQAIGARSILEIGTLGGYSTIWMARTLPPDGTMISLEADPKHAVVAQQNITRAGLSDKVDVRVGRALDLLPRIAEENRASFDMVFVDADKGNNPNYFDWALKLTHPGSLIIIDNVVRGGEIVDDNTKDEAIEGTRRLFDTIAAEPRVSATGLQTVGSKGYDGLIIAFVNH